LAGDGRATFGGAPSANQITATGDRGFRLQVAIANTHKATVTSASRTAPSQTKGAIMLQRLRELLTPPADPVEPGRPDGWAAVEAAIGTELPGDFKAFTERYGSGKVDDFLYLFNPFTAGQDGNLLVEKDRVLAAYLWVPDTRSPQAACAYSWISPPTRSRRATLPAGKTTGGSAGPSGGACPSARCGRCPL
jgi:hypothetical protein